MSARVDHADQAQRDIHYADEMLSDGGNLEAAATIAAVGQVHATLALVEQQRLANLIALAHVADTSDAEVTPMEREAWEALGVRHEGTMRPEIREALGLS